MNEVQAVWNAWLETHPTCQQEIEGLRAASARPLLILTCVAEVLTGEPHTTFTSGEWHRFTRVAREYGWATRTDGVESAPSSISAALWEGKWGVDLLVTPATIEATLNAPNPACRRDMPKELVKVAHLEWVALYRPMRGARLNSAVASMAAAAEVATHELIPPLSHEALSPVKMYRLLRSDEAKNAFIREWMRSGEFLTSSSEEFAWVAAEHSLRSDADSLVVLEHFTVNGEVLRPLVAAAYSSDPYVARWLTLSTNPWLETFVPS